MSPIGLTTPMHWEVLSGLDRLWRRPPGHVQLDTPRLNTLGPGSHRTTVCG